MAECLFNTTNNRNTSNSNINSKLTPCTKCHDHHHLSPHGRYHRVTIRTIRCKSLRWQLRGTTLRK